MSKNLTLRVRAISDKDLEAVLEMFETVSKRVRIIDMHDSIEAPPLPSEMPAKATALRNFLAENHQFEVKHTIKYDPTNGDVNYGPVPCPQCGAVDDHPCLYRFKVIGDRINDPKARRKFALEGTEKDKPHTQRLQVNERPNASTRKYQCQDCGMVGTAKELRDPSHSMAPGNHRVDYSS